jgi:hypothetical protein
MAGLNPVVCNRYSIQACVIRKTVPSEMLMGCEALETKVSRVQSDGNGTARGRCDCQHQAVRGQSRVVWLTATCGSRREPLINVVCAVRSTAENQAKGAVQSHKDIRLGPKGKGSGFGVSSAERYGCSQLTHRRRRTPGGEAYLRYVGPNPRSSVLARNVVSL